MFEIGKNFHVIHMTDDLRALDAWYDDVFGVERFMDHQFSAGLKRHGSLVLIGDLCIEPMSPAFDVEGWDSVAVGRFWRRFGTRWHSIAWYTKGAGDMPALHRQLVDDGVRIYDVSGVPSPGALPPGALFTHPRDTVTQLEFMAPPGPESRRPDPRFGPGFDPSRWARHPLALLKSSHVTLTVGDLDWARGVYVKTLGGTMLYEAEMSLQRSRSVFVGIGSDLVIELAQPLDVATPIGSDMASRGPGLYSVSFRVRDLAGAGRYLATKGVRFQARDDRFLYTDPESSQGVVFGFTTWDIPGDSRPVWDQYWA